MRLLSSRPNRPGLCRAALLATFLPFLAQAQSSLPPAQTQGNITYRCGGIGSPRSEEMRAAMKQHPLSMLFATPSGEYRAAVNVTVKDAAGKTVLKVPSTGPICLIDLPDGRYKVEVASSGKTRMQSVNVGGGPKSLDFRF